jgi:amino acid permease
LLITTNFLAMAEQYDMEDIEVHGKTITHARASRSNLSDDADRVDLANIGKKQVLKRRFGFMSMIGFSCTLMGTWAGLLTYFAGPLANGGYAGSVYGFIFAWIGVMTVMCSLAELASMAPTAGGQVGNSLCPATVALTLSSITM